MNIDWQSLFRKNYLALFFALLGIVLISIGLIDYQKQVKEASVLVPSPSIQSQSKQLEVDVEGAIINPGIYKLPLEARINDALVAASGFSDDADADWVEKNLNLAEKLEDGTKLYIPHKKENPAQASTQVSQTGLININKADSKTLDTLPGIGPVTADKIIKGRPYTSVSDLLNEKIVSTKVYDEIKDKISVN